MLCLMHIYLLCVCTIDYWLCIFHYTFSCFLCILDVLFLGDFFSSWTRYFKKILRMRKNFWYNFTRKVYQKMYDCRTCMIFRKKKKKRSNVSKTNLFMQKKKKTLECFKIIRLKCIFFVFYADFLASNFGNNLIPIIFDYK